MCMCVCGCVCVCVWVGACVHVCRTPASLHVQGHAFVLVCFHVPVRASYACVHVYMYVLSHVHVHVQGAVRLIVHVFTALPQLPERENWLVQLESP